MCHFLRRGNHFWGGGNVSLTHIPTWPDLQAQLRALDPGRTAPWRLEHVLSGPGIERLYRAFGGGAISAAAIGQAAKEGDKIAQDALTCYFDALALCCADQTLQYAAAGGCYITGNVTNANLGLMDQARFADIFTNVSAHKSFLRDVPLVLVTKTTSGLDGAAVLVSDLS